MKTCKSAKESNRQRARAWVVVGHMKLPESIKIGGHTVKVLFPYAFRDRGDVAGQADYGLLEIRLRNEDLGGCRREDSAVMTTFIHEIIHLICEVYNGRVQLDEPVIEALSQGLYQVFADNPDLEFRV